MKKGAFRQIFLDTLPVLTGYVFLGFGFGILMHRRGFAFPTSVAMSVFLYAGSMQYVAVELLSTGAGLLAAAMTTLLVNARHLFYGISMVDSYRDAGRARSYLIFALTDETYSLVCDPKVPEGCTRRAYFLAVSALNHLYWVTGTALGALAGGLVPENLEGLDFVLTALFVTIFTEQWLTARAHRPALIGVGATAACLLIFGKDLFLIPSMLVIAGLLLALRKRGSHD